MKASHMIATERKPNSCRWRNDTGSILIPVAVCLLGLLTFSAFTIDNGVMLSSRHQAQNAADAAALAAALYLAWDDETDQAGAQAMAVNVAQSHSIWGSPPDITLADVTFPPCPPGAPGPVDQCVRVNVYRNQRPGGNPLPAYFASLAGVTEQGVRATATAQVVYGRASDCLLPFAIPDKWQEDREQEEVEPVGGPDAVDDATLTYPLDEIADAPWDPNDTYDAYETQGQRAGNPLRGEIDDYAPGPPLMGGTGYSTSFDHGMRITFKTTTGSQVAPSNYYPIVLPDGLGPGAASYRYRILNCTDTTVPETYVFENETGDMRGPTRTVQDVVDQDPDAEWDSDFINPDGTRGRPVGGCMEGGSCARSPRLRAVPVFNVDEYMSGLRTGRQEIEVTGFVGVFLDDMIGNEAVGYLTPFDFDPTANSLTNNTESFLRNVILVR